MDSKLYADNVKVYTNIETFSGSCQLSEQRGLTSWMVENVATPHISPEAQFAVSTALG
jgi:hypothetical protein